MKTIHTDGSCYPNPLGPGGWAFVTGNETHIYIACGYIPSTTTNRAELIAAIEAAKYCNEDDEAIIITDSQYTEGRAVRGLFQYYIDETMANIDLVKEIQEALSERDGVNIVWERGHTGNIFNDLAHEYANYARMEDATENVVFEKGKTNMMLNAVKKRNLELKGSKTAKEEISFW